MRDTGCMCLICPKKHLLSAGPEIHVNLLVSSQSHTEWLLICTMHMANDIWQWIASQWLTGTMTGKMLALPHVFTCASVAPFNCSPANAILLPVLLPRALYKSAVSTLRQENSYSHANGTRVLRTTAADLANAAACLKTCFAPFPRLCLLAIGCYICTRFHQFGL